MFGDDEDDEGACEGFSSLTTNFVDAVFIDLLFIRNKEQKPLPFTTIGIFISETENDMMSNASNRLKSRLEAAKRFNIIVLNKQLLSQGSSSISSSMCDYLVAIDTNDITLLKVASKYLMHGGLLLINKDSIPSLVSSLENEFDPISSKLQSCLLRKKLTRANSTATPYWLPDEKRELQSLESISIPLSVVERESGVFYTLTKIRAIKCLEVYGLCIFKGLFAAETIQRWGRAAVDDMRHVMATLRLRGIDLLELKDPTTEVESSSSTYIENFHEMSMREARRCDLRNGKAMTGVQKQADSHEKKSLDIRNHPGLIDVLTEVANPEGGEFASGNWGKYNFEGAGPDGPPAPLKIGQVGAVMALPGCVDQTIHADTAHIYTHQTLPAHYFNLFLPALSAEFDNEQPDVGQTAFVLGSHKLETAYDVMVSARGNEELNQRLVRPHLDVGDGLVFDCRILHLGLANRHPSSNTFSYLAVNTHAPPETNADCIDTTGWRPLLYVNYHQPWFVDPKNWNDNERLFK